MNILRFLLFAMCAYCGSLAFSQGLRINEVQNNNFLTFEDEDGENGDWVELSNNGSSVLELSNFYLTDNVFEPLKWRLPVHSLSPGEFFFVVLSGKDTSLSYVHANFSLAQSGETLWLFDQFEVNVDELYVPELEIDWSCGRAGTGSLTNVYFSTPTPGAENDTVASFSCVSVPPSIAHHDVLFEDSLIIELAPNESGGTIYYTLDGSTPTSASSYYSQPVTVYPNNDPNNLSLIATNPAFDFPQGLYTELRANNRGWLPPYNDVSNINVLRVISVVDGCAPSASVSQSYISNLDLSMPIVSLICDSVDLFSSQTGIYVFGDHPDGNYTQTGKEWERLASLEYIDNSGNLMIKQPIGIRLNGKGSKHSTNKNIRLVARDEYGDNRMQTAVFDDYQIDDFKHLLLRTGGHRPNCILRDDLAGLIVDDLNLDAQKFRYVRLFLNGEFWGVHSLKERGDEFMLSEKYNMDKDNISILDQYGNLSHGIAEDSIAFSVMVDFAVNNDLNDSANYAVLSETMDLNQYTDYIISEVFIGNADWPNNNVAIWRKQTEDRSNFFYGHDGRWRWLFYDLDGGFGGSCDQVFVTFNGIKWALADNETYGKYNRLFIALTESDQFREQFIQRFSDLLNSDFKPGVTLPKLDYLKQELDPVMLEQIERWRYPSIASTLLERQNEVPNLVAWDTVYTQLYDFLNRRTGYVQRHMQNQWGLLDTCLITVDVNNPEYGAVQINSLLINEGLPGVNTVVYPWEGDYFKGLNNTLTAVPEFGYKFVKWEETGDTLSSIQLIPNGDTTYTAIFEIDDSYALPSNIIINEVQAKNGTTLADEHDDYDDWFEVYNPSDEVVLLDGFYVSDSRTELTKYSIPHTGNYIAPGTWQLFWADNEPYEGANHCNFKLSSTGETLFLTFPDGVTISDSLMYPSIQEGLSFGRIIDGELNSTYFFYPTPNESNVLSDVFDSSIDNEISVFPHPVRKGPLHFSVSLSGTIFNNSGISLSRFKNKSSISVAHFPPGVYHIITDDGFRARFVVE
jgi:hypothetical protein